MLNVTITDLRYTSCNVRDIKRPFFSADDEELFELPLNDAVGYLSQNRDSIYSNNTPFVLSLRNESRPSHLALRDASRPFSGAAPVRSHHNSFVVLPRSYGTTLSRRPTPAPIQFGNVDENEFEERRVEQCIRQARLKHLVEESEGNVESDVDDDSGFCWDDETDDFSREYDHEDNATESDSQPSSVSKALLIDGNFEINCLHSLESTRSARVINDKSRHVHPNGRRRRPVICEQRTRATFPVESELIMGLCYRHCENQADTWSNHRMPYLSKNC